MALKRGNDKKDIINVWILKTGKIGRVDAIRNVTIQLAYRVSVWLNVCAKTAICADNWKNTAIIPVYKGKVAKVKAKWKGS